MHHEYVIDTAIHEEVLGRQVDLKLEQWHRCRAEGRALTAIVLKPDQHDATRWTLLFRETES